MKRIIFTIGVLLACLVAKAQLEVKELKLRNGMTVWLNEDHSQPKVFGAVVVRAGAKDCPNTGIAHYFEHIMFKGTDRLGTVDYQAERPWLDSISAQYDRLSLTRDEQERSRIQQHINELSLRAADYMIPNEFNRLISKYGGSGLNAGTGFDETFYYNTFLPQFIEQWCWLNSERLMHPVFRGFQGELENVYEEKNRAADGMSSAVDKVFSVIFKSQPYAYPILGSTENLKNPRLSDMAAFYKKYYVASNMGLILCGDIKPDDALTALLEHTFGRIQTGPVPERKASPMPDITSDELHEIKLPIPLIGAEVQVFKSPTDFEPDANAMDLANMLLFNGKAGLLDSLTNEHHVMMAAAMTEALADAGATGLIIVPKLLGKMKTAEMHVADQVQAVMDGKFTTEQLEVLKQEMLMEAERGMETIDNRAQLMIDAFAKGHTWQDVLGKLEHISKLTKDDVVAAARKYYGAHHITLRKKYGIPDKETLKQPGYKPISPKNMDAKSEMARELEQMPVDNTAVRTVDFDSDVTTHRLSDHVTLYYKENPMNDIFTFTLRYRDGTLHTPKLKVLSDYLGMLGTDSLKKQQLEKAWQHIATTMTVEAAGDRTFAISIQGPDRQFESALRLLAHFLRSAKSDDAALDDAKDDDKVTRKSFGKQKDNVLSPVMQRVLYGQQSSYLTQLSKKEVKALRSDELLALFHDLQQYDCDLFYCGRLSVQSVATESQQTLPLAQCHRPQADTYRPLQQYTEPTVYFFDVPKSRQSYVVSYDAIQPLPTAEQRAALKLWDEYFGGSMSSVLFQHVREFRSLAYSTSGRSITTSLVKHPAEPQGYFSATGTQADKVLEAMATVDTLLRQMPMKEENLEAARQSVLNDIQSTFPTFRTIGKYIANQRANGYTADPNALLARLLPTVTAEDLEQFHRQYVADNNCRVWIVIGDKKQTDLKELARFGRVVELKKEDVLR